MSHLRNAALMALAFFALTFGGALTVKADTIGTERPVFEPH